MSTEQFTEGGYIFILMLVAAILGFLIGWFLHQYTHGRKFRVLQDRYNDQVRRYNQLQNDHLALKSQLKEADKNYADLQARLLIQKSENERLLKNQSRGLENENTQLEDSLRQESASHLATLSLSSKARKEEETLARIAGKAKDIDFELIGLATEDQKDDLKLIKGVGLFIEKKLHSLGIYTFRQIANFTEELEDKVNEAIEFFPGRIRRDEWVKQAQNLYQQSLEEKT